MKNAKGYIFPFFFLFFFTSFASISAKAQSFNQDSVSTKNSYDAEIRFDIGNVIPTNDFVRWENSNLDGIDRYYAYSVRIAKQTTGDKLWQQLYGYPRYGLGIYSALFPETKELGYPIAVYGFFNAPFFRLKQFSLNYEIGFGLAFNWNSYDPVENPNNIAISAEESVYIDLGLNLKYSLSKRLNLNLGYGFTHFSNGKLKMPNKGLNTKTSKISLSYALEREPIQFQSQIPPDFIKHYEWIISVYGGMQNVLYTGPDVTIDPQMKGINLPIYGINNVINRQINSKSKIGIGFTLGYNGSQNTTVIEEDGDLDELEVPFIRHFSMSIYPSYELVIDKLSLVIQPGIYLYRKKTGNMTPSFYQRIGIKYHFMENTFLGINLRATKFNESDFIEWTIGHRLNL